VLFGPGTGIMMMEGQVSAVNPPAAAPNSHLGTQPHHSRAGVARRALSRIAKRRQHFPCPSFLHLCTYTHSRTSRVCRHSLTAVAIKYTLAALRGGLEYIHPYATSITLNCPAPWLLEEISRWWCESGLSTRERMHGMQHVSCL
jgi:hypothetical protein